LNLLARAAQWIERRYLNGPGPAGPGAYAGPLTAPVLSGVTVTPETALTFTSCYACIQARASDLAVLPIQVRRLDRKGGSVLVADDARHDLVLSEPNKKSTPIRFFTALHAHRVGWGNGYAEIKRLGGMPAELILHSPRPADTWAETSKDGSLWYALDRGTRYVRAEDVLHFAGLGFNGITGYSPIALHAQAVGYGLALEQYGAAFYGSANVPKGLLKTKKKLNAEALRNLRESFADVHSGTMNAHRMMILEEDMEFEGLDVISPEDADYIAARKFQAGEMNKLFRVPGPRTMDYDGVGNVYKGFSDLIDDYISSTLGPDAADVEQEITRKFFTRGERASGLRVSHDFTALTRGNGAARTDYYLKRFQMGSISPDEIREREGDAPIAGPDGDRFYVSTQFTPVCEPDEPDEPEAPADAAEPAEVEAPAPAQADGLPVQSTALNGGQVVSLMQIADAVGSKSMPAATAKALIAVAFPLLTPAQIAAIIDPLDGFAPDAAPDTARPPAADPADDQAEADDPTPPPSEAPPDA
jgi:HK97 family phage portal protein